jgi:hypothetical protein
MNRPWSSLLIALVVSLVSAAANAGEGNPAGTPQGYKRPSFYGYYPNGVPYQNYPYYSQHGESFYYHQPYYHARPAFGGGFYHPGTRVSPFGLRPIGRGL